MKKALTFFFASILFSVIFWYSTQFDSEENNAQETSKTEETSGAYEALTFNADRINYPDIKIPDGGYYKAWEQQTFPNGGRTANLTPPFESLGPLNRAGRTLAMAFNPQNPNTMYAGSASGGLWRSYTAGAGEAAWEQVSIDLPVLAVSCITFAPGDSMTMYIGTGEVYNYFAAGTGAADRMTRGSWGMGILKSTDGGVTWSKSLDWSYNQNHGIWQIKIAPDNPNLIYAATTEGVYKSTDAGSSWTEVLDVIMATDLVIRPSDPNQVLVTCGNFATEGYGIYKTIDGGTNWEKIEGAVGELPQSYLGKGQLGLSPSDDNIIYASIGNGFSIGVDNASWLCRSEDFGSTWEIRTYTDYSKWQGWFAHDVAVHPTNPDRLVVIGIEVWVSDDGGDNIFQESTGGVGYPNPAIEGPDGNPEYVHSDAHDVIYHPTDPNVVYVASDGGMHRSEDGGQTWRSANGSYQTAQFYNGTSVSPIDGTIYFGGLQDNGTIRWNGDQTWTRTFGGDGSWTAVHPTIDNISFNSYQRLNVVRSFNDFNYNFMDMGSVLVGPTSFIAPYVIAPSDGNVLYSGSAVVGKTTDLGNSWAPVNGGNMLDGNPILSMEVAADNPDVLYCATAPYNGNRGHVFVTTDGDMFSDITGDLPDRYPMDMTVDPTDEATAYITYAGFGSGHVFKTTDYGATWTDISGSLPDIPTNAVIVDPLFPDHVYVGNDFGVYLSTDGGTTWESYSEGLPTVVMVFDLKISPLDRKLRVATHGNGAYQRDLFEEDNVATEDLKESIALELFPNPSNGPFTLQFNNPETQELRIELVDVKGRLIKVFADRTFSEGTQQLDLVAENLPAGAYFLRISTSKVAVVKRLMVN
jgi:photosystem II stability/assembly factor-like uncharacterized protein